MYYYSIINVSRGHIKYTNEEPAIREFVYFVHTINAAFMRPSFHFVLIMLHELYSLRSSFLSLMLPPGVDKRKRYYNEERTVNKE